MHSSPATSALPFRDPMRFEASQNNGQSWPDGQNYHCLDSPSADWRCGGPLRQVPSYPCLLFKKLARFSSFRVGLHYRALAVEHGADLVWFWIGSHAEYDRLLGHV